MSRDGLPVENDFDTFDDPLALYRQLMVERPEHFREPDAQLGFLWGGLTMGTLLSLPLMLAGMALIAAALRRQPLRRA